MILVDSSVWVDHLRGQGTRPWAVRLDSGIVLRYAFVLGELACGRLRKPGRDPDC